MGESQSLPRSRSHIVTRYFATADWVSTSPLHIGGNESSTSLTDLPLLRSSAGSFYIPGTSLAGVSRNALAQSYSSYGAYRDNREPPIVQVFFGKDWARLREGEKDTEQARKGGQYASLVTFHDAVLVSDVRACMRDGVRIDPTNGVALESAKFDVEVLPAGAIFRIKIWLTLHECPPLSLDRDQILKAFYILLRQFTGGHIRIGGRTRRGYGEGTVSDWKIYRLNMNRKDHLIAWLKEQPEQCEKVSLPAEEDKALPIRTGPAWFTIVAELRLKSSLMIRHASDRPGDPDAIHLSESGKNILTGTGLAGALRHRCERIANTIALKNTVKIMGSMFGGLHDPSDKSEDLRGGRVWVSESVLQNGEQLVQGRVAIDRFTGGALEAHLFDEAAFWAAHGEQHVAIRVALENPRSCEMGLLLLAIKDLWLGDLPVGGEAAVGRGVFAGYRAEVSLPNGKKVCWRATGANPASVVVIEGNLKDLDETVKEISKDAGDWEPFQWERALTKEDAHE